MTQHADIVVVGAGTAGCVLADALTRSGRLKVALIEAGGRPSTPFVGIPAGFAKLFRSRFDWAYESAPQTSGGDRRIFTPRGRMLGGSSNMNAQIHQWGFPADFDGWNARGWGWQDVAPLLREMEALPSPSAGRGTSGPMKVEPNRNAHPATHAFVDAARAKIAAHGGQYNGGDSEGAWIPEICHHNGRRYSAYNAFLKPAMQRENLAIVTNALATRIEVETGVATGVVTRRGGRNETIRARCGVILAAGAFGSPELLLRSGIGPAKELKELGISVVRDSVGVGRNLHDHPLSILSFRSGRRDTLKSAESPANLARYLLKRQGPLASNAAEGVAFARSRPDLPAPDIELIFAPLHWNDQALKPPAYHALTIGAAVVAPESRGRIRLSSPDPGATPEIDFGLFTDPAGRDRTALIAALRLALAVATSPSLSGMIDDVRAPSMQRLTDAELFAAACETLQTVYPPGRDLPDGRRRWRRRHIEPCREGVRRPVGSGRFGMPPGRTRAPKCLDSHDRPPRRDFR